MARVPLEMALVPGARAQELAHAHRPPPRRASFADVALGTVVVAGALLAAPGALLVVAAAALGEAMERRR